MSFGSWMVPGMGIILAAGMASRALTMAPTADLPVLRFLDAHGNGGLGRSPGDRAHKRWKRARAAGRCRK